MNCGLVLEQAEFLQSQRSGRTVKCRAKTGSGSMPFVMIEFNLFPT
jgi:hypothetical protein